MSIFERFANIMSANVNALLDKCENPEKMVDEYLRDAMEDLAEVKRNTARAMASEKSAKAALDEHRAQVAKYDGLAIKAVSAGNDEDARVFLQKKAALAERTATYESAYNSAHESATRLRRMHDKLTDDVAELQRRRDAVKTTMAVAQTQKTLNDVGANAERIGGSMGAFDRMEQKARDMLYTAEAEADLASPVDDMADLEAKYGASGGGVDAELEALKARLGK